jgi:hypothetical protein
VYHKDQKHASQKTNQNRVIPENGQTFDSGEILVDPGFGPLALAVAGPGVFRLWLLAKHIDRLNQGRGLVEREKLIEALQAYGLTYSQRQLLRLLKAGEKARLWQRRGRFLALTSYVRAWEYLSTRLTLSGSVDIVDSTKPQRKVYIDITGDLADFEASIYAAWLYTQKRRDKDLILSRELLSRIWSRSIPTLLDWEQRAGIRTTPHYKQTRSTNPELVPTAEQNGSVTPYLALVDGQEVQGWFWQAPNSYEVIKAPREHPHAGQRRKCRKARNHVLDTLPVDTQGDGQRLYFQSYKSARSNLRRRDGPPTVVFVLLGRHRGRLLSEPMDPVGDGIIYTELKERHYARERLNGNFQAYRSGWWDWMKNA